MSDLDISFDEAVEEEPYALSDESIESVRKYINEIEILLSRIKSIIG